MNLTDMSIKMLNAEMASSLPAPGGGSAAALAGSLAAALGQMVIRLTEGKKAFAELDTSTQDDLKLRVQQLASMQQDLIRLVDDDTAAYQAFMAARRLLQESPEEMQQRRQAMDEAAFDTLEVPLATCMISLNVLELLPLIAATGNPNCISDVGTAAQLAKAAVEGAALNVRINLPSIGDEQLVSSSRRQIETACAQADSLLELVMHRVNEVLS